MQQTNNIMVMCDFYKTSHVDQYPSGTERIYATYTARQSQHPKIKKVVFFGLQYFLKRYLGEVFADFFATPWSELKQTYDSLMKSALGTKLQTDHWKKLHELGYVPLRIYAVPEGSQVNIGVPLLTIENTLPGFYWLPNYIETLLSASLWCPITAATFAHEYRLLLRDYNTLTHGSFAGLDYQAHDFAYRSLSSHESALLAGAAHLLSFLGTDTVPAIPFLEKYYGANVYEETVGASVPATEHSVMSAYGLEGEKQFFKKLLTELYPTGILSIVADTYNLWTVCDQILPGLRSTILNRSGKFVIRPDSGNPVDVLCGNPQATNSAEKQGLLVKLWQVFGGQTNTKGYKELDPHVGIIYGDGINLERCEAILEAVRKAGFASTNLVFGLGGRTYQQINRDMFGFGYKASEITINGITKPIFKKPATDKTGLKHSAKGRVKVSYDKQTGDWHYCDVSNWDSKAVDSLQLVYSDGKIYEEVNLAELRSILMQQFK